MVLRVGFGLALLLMGVAHYAQINTYVGFVSGDLGALEPLGKLWAYVLPALLIAGGASFILGLYTAYGSVCIAVALASIPAGLILKTVLSGKPTDMQGVMSAFLWMLVFFPIMKKADCGWPGTHSHGDCGGCCGPEMKK